MFQRATRKKARLRLALIGPPGSGKTFTGLRVGVGLLPSNPGGSSEAGFRLAVIDTEHGSANLYAGEANPDGGRFDFDCVRLDEWPDKFSVDNYIKALRGAAQAGYPVLLLDSLSHAWAGPGGILEYVDKVTEKAAATGGKRDTFGAGWRAATPKHNELVDAMLSYPGHLVVTVRSKVEHVVEEVGGRKTVRKIGLQPVQREGLDYEFTVVGDLDQETHRMRVTKTRCSALDDAVIEKAGGELATMLKAWLDTGEAEHDDEWERDQAAFNARLTKAKITLKAATKALQAYRPGHSPSGIGRAGRKELLERLGALDKERQPGEEEG